MQCFAGRVGSGRVTRSSKSHGSGRVGSGRIGSGGFQELRDPAREGPCFCFVETNTACCGSKVGVRSSEGRQIARGRYYISTGSLAYGRLVAVDHYYSSSGPCIVPVARDSACEIIWHRWEPVVAVCGLVLAAAVVLRYYSGNGHYAGATVQQMVRASWRADG